MASSPASTTEVASATRSRPLWTPACAYLTSAASMEAETSSPSNGVRSSTVTSSSVTSAVLSNVFDWSSRSAVSL